jgi:type IV secretion system protein VirB4
MIEKLRTEPVRSITNALMFCHDAELEAALAYYSLDGGPGGRLFDGVSDAAAETHWDAYDITDVIGAGDQILLPTLMCLEHRFDRIEDGRPVLETIDEAWAAVSHRLWRPRLRARWKTKRSKCVSVGIATQNLADIVNRDAGDGGLLSIILENVPTRIYGANPEAQLGGTDDEKGPADFYRAFGVTHRQREIIRTLVRAREYFITSPDGRRVVDFGFGPAMLAFAAATSEAEVLAVDAMIEAHGPEAWRWRWLEQKGVDHDALCRL